MTKKKRLLYSFLLMFVRSARKRADFIRKHQLFGSMGEKCTYQSSKLPLYSNLVFFHNNVRVASRVGFVTHDIIHSMLNNSPFCGGGKFVEKVGCIEVMDNVFIGSGTRILYNTRIGSNVIIGSGSLVNKDIPDNSVYAGVPARFICSFDQYVEKHRKYTEDFKIMFGRSAIKEMDDVLASMMYEEFKKQRDKK